MQLISLKIYWIADIILGNCVFKNSGTSLLSCLVSSAQCLSPCPSTCPWPGAPCKSWCQSEQLTLHLSQLIILLKETNEVHIRVLVTAPVLLLLPGGAVVSHVAQVAAIQPSHRSICQQGWDQVLLQPKGTGPHQIRPRVCGEERYALPQ